MKGIVELLLVVAVIAALWAGCFFLLLRSTSGATRRQTTSSLPRPAATIAEPSGGCRSSTGTALAQRDAVRHVVVDGTAHTYRVWAPATRSSLPVPLVLLFHGFANSGEGIATLTGLPSRGAARGFMVAAPDGPGQTWQFTGQGTDAAFVDRILTKLTTSRCVDLHRVYVAGFSAGAAFSIAYACARPGRIAALATVAVEFQLGCHRPTAILDFHGTDDPLVPYHNGAVGLSLPGVHVRGTMLNMADWARLGHCALSARERTIEPNVRRSSWPLCADGAEVSLYAIEHGSHAWPGAAATSTGATGPEQVDATGLMLDFFARHHIR